MESKEELALQYLSNIIKNSEWAGKVFLAGGAVRDKVMGKPIKDIDIVITEPEGGIRFAEWLTKKIGAYAEGSNPVIFPRFGTAKFNLRKARIGDVDLSGVDIESVMTRGEEYTFGSRKPDVKYTDLAGDAKRRDFTVNDLYLDLTTGKILDPTGKGLKDIKKGIIRTPVNPNVTFKEDPLRMLRAIRFMARYDWKTLPTLIQAIIDNRKMLQHISMERIQDEFNKILMTKNPDLALRMLSKTGLLNQFMPEFNKMKGVTQNAYHKDDVFDHTLEVIKNTPADLTARLAAVFHDMGKPATRSEEGGDVHFYGHEDVGAEMAKAIMTRMKYSNDMIDAVSNIVQNHMRLKAAGPNGKEVSDKALRKFMNALGTNIEPALKMMHGDNISHTPEHSMPEQIPNIQFRMKNLSVNTPTKPALPINGNDIINVFKVKPGPIIKKMLAAVEEAWYDNPSLSKEEALGIAKNVYEMETSSSNNSTDILNQKIKNPETNNDILVKTALGYDSTHPAFKAAEELLKQHKKRS